MPNKPENPQAREYRFNLGEGYSHDRFPMKRLAEYLEAITEIFGESDKVYFGRLEPGSTILVARVERVAVKGVSHNLRAVVRGEAPETRIAAFHAVNQLLREDNAEGYITDPAERKVIVFPGINSEPEPEPLAFSAFNQPDTIEGTPIQVGGKRNAVSIHLLDVNGEVEICEATKALAKDIAKHLFESHVRIEGTARWQRKPGGGWERKSFRALQFQVLPNSTLTEEIEAFRSLPGGWKDSEDIYRDLDLIRHEDELQ